MLIHATCVSIGGRAVLITGPSGGGKSDLALRLIDRGALLVSDDQVKLSADGGVLYASAPATIGGRMEIRGIGIVEAPHAGPTPVALRVDLMLPVERMPEPASCDYCGIDVPLAALHPFEASAPLKVERALDRWGLAL
ncbi:MAG TPA: HPr kinase/phosphatase C-terminal domain-containing protein [Sphingomonas sp.]|nr:HPr kinase/phosphatase C-terminal domain-containing protein [Sphingomonas sp.]